MVRRVQFLISLALLFILVSCTQEPSHYVEFSDPKLRLRNRILYEGDTPLTGIVFSVVGADTVYKVSYKDGILDGRSEEWSAYGGHEVRYYVKGKMEGKHYGYYANGKPKFEIEYKNDVFHGAIKEWNENGLLYRSGHYVNGQEEGLQQFWRPNGKLYANYVVKDGRQYGLTGTKNCVNVKDSL